MEILRLQDTTSIDASFSVPSASANYTIEYEDLNTLTTYSASATSDGDSVVTFTLDEHFLTYNGNLVANVLDSNDSTLIRDGIDIVRPYCNVSRLSNDLGIAQSDVEKAEKVARKIIEAQAGNFYFVRKLKEIIGMGLDYLPVNEKINKLYYMYENGELIYDYEDEDLDDYRISIDGTSITTSVSVVNKMNYKYVWRDRYLDTDFNSGYEYIIDGDFGYYYIPEDIQEACELLVQDMLSENMRYINRGIEEFDNNEFKIKFSKTYGSGTGNLIVDKILAKYRNQIVPGVI